MPGLAQLSPGDTFAGFIEIVRRLKSGGMGAVYVVKHRETGKSLALKVMHPEIVADASARARFKQEAQIASLIDLPRHIVDVQHAGIDEASGMPFIVMELLKGQELGELLAERGRLRAAEALSYLRQTAKALDRAHAAGVVHRDLKPENLFVVRRDDEPPTIKILDFGIAKIVQGAGHSSTMAGGTPMFMAPEQTSRTGQIGPPTDIWALGLIAYALLVGHSYWETSDLPQLLRAIVIDEFESPATRARRRGVDLPAGFDTWLLRCLEREPSRRYQRAGQAIDELAKLFDGVTGRTVHGEPLREALGATAALDARPVAVPPQLQTAPSVQTAAASSVDVASAKPPRSNRQLALLGAAMAAALSVGGYFLATRPQGETPSRAAASSAATLPSRVESAAPAAAASGSAASAAIAITTGPANELIVVAPGLSMQAHEVTRGEYAAHIAVLTPADRETFLPLADADLSDAARERHPITWVTQEQASAHCRRIGASLPTSAEWSVALPERYPWGPAWPASLSGVALGRSGGVIDAGSSAADVTKHGVRDLAGNVQEWTATAQDGLATVRGGAIGMDERDARKAITEGFTKFTSAAAGPGARIESIAGASVGFRCVKRAEPPGSTPRPAP